jgi:hypothetical protein
MLNVNAKKEMIMRSMSTSAFSRMILCGILTGGFWFAVSDAAEPGRGEEKAVPDVSNEEVQAFAKANVKVAKIQTASANEEGNRIVDLNTPIDQLPQEKQIPTIQAIEAEGLTVGKYNKLLNAYKVNEDFRSQVVRAILNLHPDPEPLEK